MNKTYQDAIEISNIVSKTDINGIITFVNDEFCKIFEYEKEELIGQNHNIVRHPEVPSSNFRTLWETILSKSPYKATVKNLTKNSKTVYLNTTITPILNENGEIKEFIAIRYDVTSEVELKKSLEQKEKELEFLNATLEQRVNEQTKQLKELNTNLEQKVLEEIKKNEEKQKMLFWQSRMASLGQMLGNIAHQWRQPLTELNLSLFNMKKSFIKHDIKNFEILNKESKKLILNMSKTIDDFSNFFNPQKEKETFKVTEAINEALTILRNTIEIEKINIKVEIEQRYEVVGVLNELTQVIINLIQNAKDAFIQNDVENRLIKISLTKEKNTLFLKIEDNAKGIDEEISEKVFEPYFTTKHKSQGTGLGLFMSKMIIEKSLNGTLNYKNIKGGSCFIISIPMNG